MASTQRDDDKLALCCTHATAAWVCGEQAFDARDQDSVSRLDRFQSLFNNPVRTEREKCEVRKNVISFEGGKDRAAKAGLRNRCTTELVGLLVLERELRRPWWWEGYDTRKSMGPFTKLRGMAVRGPDTAGREAPPA